MHVVFISPEFPAGQRHFVRALHAVGARITGIGEAPLSALGPQLRGWLHGYEQVASVCHLPSLYDAVRTVQKREWVDRLEATIEAHILPAARVRAETGIPGLSPEVALLCRDKPKMKVFFREHQIPCAASTGAQSLAEVQAFAERVGYPVILKPRDGAGASGTTRVDRPEELAEAFAESGGGHGRSIAVEEFVQGHEGFYDTLTVAGDVAHEFICHYYPNVLEAMRTRWISPQIVVTNRLDAPGYAELKQLGRRVVKAFGLDTAATHMEWFYGPRGLKISEIGARPPGVSQWDLYAAANELDIHREWAHGLVHGRVAGTASRRFAAGIINLRPTADGHIKGYEGVQAIHEAFGPYILDAHLPPVGSPTQPVAAGYMANAWVRMRHPDYDTLRSMLDTVGQRLKVIAG